MPEKAVDWGGKTLNSNESQADRSAAPTLDHLGWIGPDLAAGAAAWERLGFTLSRVSPQMGYTGPGGTLEPWASANRCAVFAEGYLELIGLTDPARHNPWAAYLARGAGPHIAAFRVAAADAAYPPLAARVGGFDPPVQRRRMAPVGLDPAEGEIEMRFRNIFSQDADWPEGRFIVIEHQTPEALWQPALTRHPNGAEALVEAVFAAPDPAPTIDRLSRLLDRPARPVPGGAEIVAAGGGKITTLDSEALRRRFPGAAPPDRPAVAAAVVRVADLGAAAAHAAANGVDLAEAPEGARYALGAETGADAGRGVIAFV